MKKVASDGNDILFGDLGNDWIVGGTGNDTIWGGWGNDLMNADDVLVDGLHPRRARRQVRHVLEHVAERHARHASELRGPRLRRRRPRHPDRRTPAATG